MRFLRVINVTTAAHASINFKGKALMNKIYNIVWNKTLGQWVVAAEDARSHSTICTQ